MRDLERTREKILKAARSEFCAKGLAGARTAAIARRAGVNKRMLFYCFGSKEELYYEILRRKSVESERFLESMPDEMRAALVQWDEKCREDIDWVRLLEWEALDSSTDSQVTQPARRRFFRSALAKLRRARERGNLSQEPDIRHLFIALIGVTIFPYAFPQLVRLITGSAPTEDDFIAERKEFLRWLGDRLASKGGPTDRRHAATQPVNGPLSGQRREPR